MKILLLGRDGQVGWELQRSLAPLGTVIALGRGAHNGLSGDLEQPDTLRDTVRQLAPDCIVSAAAFTAVDRAESEPGRAAAVNAHAPGVLAEEAHRLGAWFVHYSTDYVFDGSGTRPWAEDDTAAPINVYGRTKYDGEKAICASATRYLIFRTQWVYARSGHNFIHTMLRLACERDRLEVVADQFGAPTGAELIADITAHAIKAAIAEPGLGGLYHLAAAGEASWHGYAQYVIHTARDKGWRIRVDDDAILPVDTSAFPTPAPRPLNSRLDTHLLRDTFGLSLPAWQGGVTRMLDAIQPR